MRKIFTNPWRLLSIFLIAIVLVLLILYIGFPTVMAFAAIQPANHDAGEAPDGFSEVMLETEDGIQLAAWYAEPQNGAVIILVHGAGSGRNSVRGYATMLQDNGFGVLALSLRGYNESEGGINRLGWRGTDDIGAAVEFLSARDDVEAIGGLGLSMGGEILLGAASAYPSLQAIVADGATFRTVDEYTDLPANQSLYRYFTQGVFTVAVGIFTGESRPEPTLLASIRATTSTSFLYIAAGTNDDEIAYNTLFHDAVPDRSSLWIIPNIGHTGGFNHDAALYEQRVIEFFTAELLTQ